MLQSVVNRTIVVEEGLGIEFGSGAFGQGAAAGEGGVEEEAAAEEGG